MGAITGVAGGVFRDLLTGEIPFVLRPGQLYATPAMFGAIAFLLLQPVTPQAAPWAGMTVAATIRLLAIRSEITMPILAVPAVSGEESTGVEDAKRPSTRA